MLGAIGVPVDARYFPRGGVRDADVDAIEVFCFALHFQGGYTRAFLLMIR